MGHYFSKAEKEATANAVRDLAKVKSLMETHIGETLILLDEDKQYIIGLVDPAIALLDSWYPKEAYLGKEKKR